MVKQHVVRRAARVTAVGLIGFGLVMVDAPSSFATCAGHCQVMKRCADLAKGKAKGAAVRTEYNKCMTDPENYK